MIFARDKGRMCNNILQYGHVYAWGREHGRKVVSMRFAYKYQYFKICSLPFHNFLVYVTAKLLARTGILPVADFDGKQNETALTILERNKNVVVEGWYVRFYDLFLKYKAEIIDLFSFNKDISVKITRYLADSGNQKDIRLGVHIRRGDYKTWHGGKYYFDDDVYINQIRSFAALLPDRNITVYICGNDPALDKTCLQKQLPHFNIRFPDGNPAEDLCLLSECDYLIGAPSTFTLVASMYKDIPLYWIEDKDAPLDMNKFKHFNELFKNIK